MSNLIFSSSLRKLKIGSYQFQGGILYVDSKDRKLLSLLRKVPQSVSIIYDNEGKIYNKSLTKKVVKTKGVKNVKKSTD